MGKICGRKKNWDKVGREYNMEVKKNAQSGYVREREMPGNLYACMLSFFDTKISFVSCT